MEEGEDQIRKNILTYSQEYGNQTMESLLNNLRQVSSEKELISLIAYLNRQINEFEAELKTASGDDLQEKLKKKLKTRKEQLEEVIYIYAAYLKVAPLMLEKIKAEPCSYCREFTLTKGYLKQINGQNIGCLRELLPVDNSVNEERFNLSLSRLIAIAYYKRHPELRTDASQASEAAKKSIAPLVLTDREREYLNSLDIELIETSFISYILVGKRKQGEFTLRVGYDKDILSEVIQQITGRRRPFSLTINSKKIPIQQKSVTVDSTRLNIQIQRQLPSSTKPEEANTLQATLELSKAGRTFYSQVSPIKDFDVQTKIATFEFNLTDLIPGIYILKISVSCLKNICLLYTSPSPRD